MLGKKTELDMKRGYDAEESLCGGVPTLALRTKERGIGKSAVVLTYIDPRP